MYTIVVRPEYTIKIRAKLEAKGAKLFLEEAYSRSRSMPAAEPDLGFNLAEVQALELKIFELIKLEPSIEKRELFATVILVRRAIVANVEFKIRKDQPIPKKEITARDLSEIDTILEQIKKLGEISNADFVKIGAGLSEIAQRATK